MGYRIDEIEGIGPSYAKKLAKVKITNTDHFLKLCCDKKGRKQIAEQSDIRERLILNWANKADLMRVNGVGSQYSELLEAAGVDTVKELRNRNADNLAKKMTEVNEAKNLCNACPSVKDVQKWIDESKGMTPLITH